MAGAFLIDLRAGRLWRYRERVDLAPKAFQVLRFLVNHAGRVVSPRQILKTLWPKTRVQPETLNMYIRKLRRALGDDAKNPAFIETVPNRGYRLIAPVAGGGAAAVCGPGGWPLFGRNEPFHSLMEAYELAGRGMRQIVFLTGEAGIGKTALVEAFAGAIGGACVARGQAIRTHYEQEPYYPVLEALGRTGIAGFRKALSAHAPAWQMRLPAMLSPQERERLSRELPGAATGRMLREIGELLEAVTRNRTMVLVLEDLHCADAATVDFLSAIALRHERARLMILCTFRPGDLAATGHPLRTASRELTLKGLSRQMELGALDGRAVRGYLQSKFPDGPLPDGLVSAVAEYSGGNPLFLGSIVDRLRQTRQMRFCKGAWTVPAKLRLDVSEDIHELILDQAGLLSGRERALLECASAAGGAFSVRTVASILGDTPDRVALACESLASGGWLRQAGSAFEFRHPLYRESIYRSRVREYAR